MTEIVIKYKFILLTSLISLRIRLNNSCTLNNYYLEIKYFVNNLCKPDLHN